MKEKERCRQVWVQRCAEYDGYHTADGDDPEAAGWCQCDALHTSPPERFVPSPPERFVPASQLSEAVEALREIAELAATTWRDADVSENALYEVFGDLAGMAEVALANLNPDKEN